MPSDSDTRARTLLADCPASSTNTPAYDAVGSQFACLRDMDRGDITLIGFNGTALDVSRRGIAFVSDIPLGLRSMCVVTCDYDFLICL
ncbi:Aste57867_531 [Aphanomyces stellatus]|uniref:Aste57867_531 protein n=1 Tax=Aphanomyces stellatus TaxID=120398 RepID=A0A485K7V1_9STRA|nr:hypothetical protein As57867_000530 [Aphanomyces stellatus]VFT77756.1 Aste57867_531 [Aphanomyces stellatus]